MRLFGNTPQKVGPDVPAGTVESSFEDVPPPVKVPKAIITAGITVKGHVQGEGLLQVDGVLTGEIDLAGAVIVAPSGSVNGKIRAAVVQVAGDVTGNIIAQEHVKLEASGIVDGDIMTTSIVIDDGAWFNGQVIMDRSAKC